MATIDIDETKRTLLTKEDEKLVLLREIKGNLESIGNVLQLLPEMVHSQQTIINLLIQQSVPSAFRADSRRVSPLLPIYHNPFRWWLYFVLL